MLYRIPVRNTKSKGARFKAVVEPCGAFRWVEITANSAAQAARLLRSHVMPKDQRDIGRKSAIGGYAMRSVRFADGTETLCRVAKATSDFSAKNGIVGYAMRGDEHIALVPGTSTEFVERP